MTWSVKVGRVLGIDVYLHLTFLLLLGFLGLAHGVAQGSWESAASTILFFLALFGCVLLHEFGHALMARRYGIGTRDITLLPIGGVARLERLPEKPTQELWVALAGPAVNVVLASVLWIWLSLAGTGVPQFSLNSWEGSFAERLLAVNLFLVAFNMLPAFPMDGGRVLRAMLALRMEYGRATRIAASIGQGMAFVFGFLGLFGNPMLLLIALFVWIGASQESAAATMKTSLSGVPVRDAMLTDFKALAPDQTLRDAASLLLAGFQQDFPVLDRGRLVGMLVRADLFGALRDQGESIAVGLVMRRDFETVEPDQPLDHALGRVRLEKGVPLAVVQNETLVGIVTAENVGELFMIRTARSGRGPSRGPSRAAETPAPLVPPVIARHQL